MTRSLFDRLGGSAAVDAAVDMFYARVLRDEKLRPFFEGVDIEAQRTKQKAFLTMAFGGPSRYTGRALRAAHARPVSRGLTDSQVDAVAGHLKATLEELNVAAPLVEEVLAIAGSTRHDVLNR
jgi:hemoglobin